MVRMGEMEVESGMWAALKGIVDATSIATTPTATGRLLSPPRTVTVKRIYASEHTKHELQSLAGLSLPNVIQIYHIQPFSAAGKQYLAVVEEYTQKSVDEEMTARRKESAPFTDVSLWEHMCELLSTLARLQDSRIAHRCISPNTLFFDRSPVYPRGERMKIGNFWWSREGVLDEAGVYSLVTECNSVFASPLVRGAYRRKEGKVFHNPYKSDVYSLGKTLEVLMRCTAMSDYGQESRWLRQLQAIMTVEGEGERPSFGELRKMVFGDGEGAGTVAEAGERQGEMESPLSLIPVLDTGSFISLDNGDQEEIVVRQENRLAGDSEKSTVSEKRQEIEREQRGGSDLFGDPSYQCCKSDSKCRIL